MKTTIIDLQKDDNVKHHYVHDVFSNEFSQAIFWGPKSFEPIDGMNEWPVNARSVLHLTNPGVAEEIETVVQQYIKRGYIGDLKVEYGTVKRSVVVTVTPISQ